MRGISIIVVAVASFGSVPAAASDWQYLADVGTDGSSLIFDAQSKAVSGAYKKAWFKWIYAKDMPLADNVKSDPAAFFYKTSLDLSYFNCAERSSVTTQAIYYDKDGKVVGGFTLQVKDARWSEVAPDTLGETMLNTVCSSKAAVSTPVPKP